MKEVKDYEANETLTEEEVNVYTDDCGDVKLHCLTDCFPFGTPSISHSW